MNLIDRFFLWCSDTDIQTLSSLNELDRKSMRFQMNYGRLIWIPTIMATIGTTHAMSDFTNDPFVYIGVGLLIGWFIFTIDRAIIGTYKKQENGLGNQFWARLFLSIIMGFVIALFFIFFFFGNRINEQIDADLLRKNELTNQKRKNQVDIIQKELKEKEEYRKFYSEVLQAEIDGGGVKTFYYQGKEYKTSGMRGANGISAKNRKKEFDQICKDIDRINIEIKNNLDETENFRKSELTQNINNAKKKDPLIKLEMLIEVIKNHKWLLVLVIPLYLMLLGLDIIPILVKELSQVTLYDNTYRNPKLTDVKLDYTNYNTLKQKIFDESYSEESLKKGAIKKDGLLISVYNNCKKFWTKRILINAAISIICLIIYYHFYNPDEKNKMMILIMIIVLFIINYGLTEITNKIFNSNTNNSKD